MFFSKNRHEEVDKEIMEAKYDSIISYIGYMIVLLGLIDIIAKVPDEMTFGTTIAGLFFAMSDFQFLKQRLTRSDLTMNQILLFCGVFSFFLLPVILIMSNGSIFLQIYNFGNVATFLALGLVVIGIGRKSSQSKQKFIMDMRNDLESVKKMLNDTQKQLHQLEEKNKQSETQSSILPKPE